MERGREIDRQTDRDRDRLTEGEGGGGGGQERDKEIKRERGDRPCDMKAECARK